METPEECAFKSLRLEFVQNLIITDYVLDYIQQEGGLSDLACEDIRSQGSRQEQVRCLLDYVTKKAIIPLFEAALQVKNSHMHLSQLLDKNISEERTKRQAICEGGCTGGKRRNSRRPAGLRRRKSSSDSATGRGVSDNPDATEVWTIWRKDEHVQSDAGFGKRLPTPRGQNRPTSTFPDFDLEEENHTQHNDDEHVSHQEDTRLIIMQPRRVCIMDTKKKVLTLLHYHFKLLSHDGRTREFDASLLKYKSSYGHDPDVMLTLLDAEIESRRLVFDTRLHKGGIFDDIEKLLPKSTHPVAYTMTYIARKGSARTMKESLEVGLTMLDDAMTLSERIHPCKDTGMVLYIYINLLMQVYEKDPTRDRKQDIIAKIDECISVHFANEPPKLREDYTRMLYLKMVFVYLGMGLFGNTIDGCVVSGEDKRCAKACLKIIDAFPANLEIRRRMLYYMAKSTLLGQEGHAQEALEMSVMARRTAEEGGFDKELGASIIDRNIDLTREVAMMAIHEHQEREQHIDKELSALGFLQKSSNQWGNNSTSDSSSNETLPKQSYNHRTCNIRLCLYLIMFFILCSCAFVTWSLFLV